MGETGNSFEHEDPVLQPPSHPWWHWMLLMLGSLFFGPIAVIILIHMALFGGILLNATTPKEDSAGSKRNVTSEMEQIVTPPLPDPAPLPSLLPPIPPIPDTTRPTSLNNPSGLTPIKPSEKIESPKEAAERKLKLAQAEIAKKKLLAQKAWPNISYTEDFPRNFHFWSHKESKKFLQDIKWVGLKTTKPGVHPYIVREGKNGDYSLRVIFRAYVERYTSINVIWLRSGEETWKSNWQLNHPKPIGNPYPARCWRIETDLLLKESDVEFLRKFAKNK